MPAVKRTYTTNQGEAWDQTAKAIWGSEGMTHHLLAANPGYRDMVFFPAGLVLNVPDVEPPVNEEPPPWKER